MDQSVIEQGLKATATTRQRIEAFLESGIDAATIAETAEVTSASVRNWRYGDISPRREATERLDNLRYAMSLLVVEQELDPAEAATWMQSRADEPPYERPYKMLIDQPQTVFEMIGRRCLSKEISVAEEAVPQEDTSEAEEPELSDIEESMESDVYELGVYAEELYEELKPIAHIKLPYAALFGILSHFPEWQHTNERAGSQSMAVLTRHFEDPMVNIEVPEDYHQQQVKLSYHSVTIRAAAIRGSDVRCLIDLERQIQAPQQAREIEIQRTIDRRRKIEIQRKPAAPELTEAERKFRECRGVFVYDDDPFTDTESFVLSLMTDNSTNVIIARAVGVSSSKISRLLKPLHERVGTTSNPDLMLLAIAFGLADIEHIPAGLTWDLNKQDKALMSNYYDPDPAIRSAARVGRPDSTRWSRIYDKLGMDRFTKDSRAKAVLYALKDGVIKLPDADQIREHIAAKKAETALTV